MSDTYTVKKAVGKIALDAGWDSELWSNADELKIDYRFEAGSDFTPDVRVKMLYDDERICGLFQVKDRYVLARAKADQDQVCKDSCVEFFVKPVNAERYFNFEMNCGGVVLLYHITDLRKSRDYDLIPPEDMATIERYHTLPALIEEELTEPVTWYLGYGIPISFFEKYSGIDRNLSGQTWTANFTKCADKSSHPCWMSWQKLSILNFHLPEEFGKLAFE